MRESLERSERALVFDLIGNLEPGLVVSTRADLLSFLRRRPGRFRILYRPRLDLADREAIFNEADWLGLLARAVSPCEIFLDEIDTFTDSETIPPQLDILVRYGRNIEVSLRAAARRPAVVIPRHYVSETTRWSIFNCADPYDLSFLERYTGIAKEEIAGLPDLEYFDWNRGLVSRMKVKF